MKIIFFGSSEFSIPILKSLLSSKHSVVQVVTTPDRKKGRGQKVSPSVVSTFAQEYSLPILSPEKLSAAPVIEVIKNAASDFLVIASYGKMVPESIFTLPKIAPLNVHPSLLPRHRGASPIQSAILEGDQETGVSIADVTKELDSGDIFGQVKTDIGENENALELSERLAVMGATLLIKIIDQFSSGKISRTKQDSSKATYAKKLSRSLGKIDWEKPASCIHNEVRAYYPWPSAFTFFSRKRIKILETRVLKAQQAGSNAVPGTVTSIEHNKSFHITTQEGSLEVIRVQPEGRREMMAFEFIPGQRIKIGDRFE